MRSTSSSYYDWVDRSRIAKDPMVRFRTCAHDRRIERMVLGTPVDHPALRQLVAEAEHLDEQREARRGEWGRRASAA